MRLFESLLIALSTYSAVPVPQLDWNEKNMRYAICFFPAVGVLCGAALWLWAVLAQATGMSGVLFAAIADACACAGGDEAEALRRVQGRVVFV